ncbi:MAG TPA: P1 family peptidase [Vicinamibacterales bacterium]|nr:P1 family peptidase [Vicinamibacterales bacterium]
MSDYTRREFGATLAAGAALPSAFGQTQPSRPSAGSLTDVPGVTVGHFTDTRRPTGCTAILFESAAAAAVDYNSSAPGESMGVMLQPVSPIDRIHGLFLTGGGVLALPASGGVLRFLEERKLGFDWGTPGLRIPIVVSAVIDDLAVGDPHIRPDGEAAYKACTAASSGPVAEGNVGAGAGATVGKMHRGRGLTGMKGGLGTASIKIGDVVIAALAVVNAAGDVLDWRSGQIVAGARRADGRFADSVEFMRGIVSGTSGDAPLDDPALRSTTLVVVATNVTLDKTPLTKVAMMANCGAARAVRPYHTTGDGDSLFAVSTGRLARPNLQLTVLGSLAADVVADAIVRGVRAARSVPGWPSVSDK